MQNESLYSDVVLHLPILSEQFSWKREIIQKLHNHVMKNINTEWVSPSLLFTEHHLSHDTWQMEGLNKILYLLEKGCNFKKLSTMKWNDYVKICSDI